jgi:hypothetical protein
MQDPESNELLDAINTAFQPFVDMVIEKTDKALEAAAPVIIDGCAIPRELYAYIKGQARATGQTQTVGVDYLVPAFLRPDPNEPPESTWNLMLQRSESNSARMRQGLGISYIIGMDADRLREIANHDKLVHIAMILHISPWGE